MLIILAIGLVMVYQRGTEAPHIMSPTGVAITLLLALLIDFAQFGPGRLPDKIAFVLAVPAIREGFDGSPIDQKTTTWVHDWIQSGLDSQVVAGSHLAEAKVNIVIGAVIGLAWVYAVLCLLPSKMFVRKLGRAATFQFPASKQMRINPTVWVLAVVLGFGADMPAGALGFVCRGSVDILITPITAVVGFLFGA